MTSILRHRQAIWMIMLFCRTTPDERRIQSYMDIFLDYLSKVD